MPNIAAALIARRPICFCHRVGNFVNRIILIAAQHFQLLVFRIGNGVIADKLVCHRNREEMRRHLIPIVHIHIIEIRPTEVKRRI